MPNISEQSTSDWLTPAEAATELGVSTKTLTRLVESGDLVARKLPSGHRRYQRASVNALEQPEEAAS